MPWLLPASLALVSWALWAFFGKLASGLYPPTQAFLFVEIGAVLTALVSFLFFGFPKVESVRGAAFGLIAGAFVIIGEIFFLFAMQKGKASIVTTFTAFYPILTILLAVLILHETLTLRQGIGILLAMVAVALFAF